MIMIFCVYTCGPQSIGINHIKPSPIIDLMTGDGGHHEFQTKNDDDDGCHAREGVIIDNDLLVITLLVRFY